MLAQQIKEELNSFKMVCISNSTKVNPALIPLSGDGSPRVVQTSHTFLLMIMHPLLGHGVLANTFQPQHLGIGAHSIYELTVSSSSIFWLRRICPFLS